MSSTFAAGFCRSDARGISSILDGIPLYAGMLTFLCACSSPSQQFDRQAYAAGLVRTEIGGSPFGHAVYTRPFAPERSGELLVVYIDGDGSPWIEQGTRIASDPTPRQPLALHLMLRTSLPAWYLTRPCYNGMTNEHCTPALWTNARYSAAVVDSMVAALQNYSRTQNIRRILLVGYSGGGALAVLMAAQLHNVVGVVTVAANLDVAEWTKVHNYLPLTESLNPATQSTFSPAPEIDFVGDRDANVPFSTLTSYFAARPQAEVWHYENFDHVCCWVENWPALLQRVLEKIGAMPSP